MKDRHHARFEEWWVENEFNPMIYGAMEAAYNAGKESGRKPDPVKTETRTYECWAHVDGGLRWFEKGKRTRWPEQWSRVPGEDKIVELAKPEQPDQCEWKPEDPDFMPGTYASSCGELWSFIDGGPAENRVRFCHGCGKPVTLKETP